MSQQYLTTRRRVLQGAGALAVGAVGFGGSARAAGYPDHQIQMIAPFAPGGASDLTARLMSKQLTVVLGQTVFVENKAGAGSNIGTGYVAHAKPDGYTILLSSSAFTVNPGLYRQIPYDPFRSFACVAELVTSPNVFIANPASGIKSMADLIAQARAKPGTIAMANAGIGTTPQLACEWLKSITGVNITSVPFNGAGPAMQATLGGQVPVMGASLPGAHPGIMNGSLTALAVTGATRWPDMPNVPTMVELGYKDFVSDTFHGIWAPAGTSPEIVAVLTKACLDVLKQPDFAKQLLASGFEIIGNGPDGLRKRVEREVPLYKELIAKAKIERM